jgi:hypothetical protein
MVKIVLALAKELRLEDDFAAYSVAGSPRED